MSFDVKAVGQEVLSTLATGKRRDFFGDYSICARKDAREKGDDIEELVEKGFGLFFPGGGGPFCGLEEGGGAVE